MKFRKKPVVIEAMQWDGENFSQIFAWAHEGLPPEFNAWITRPFGNFKGLQIRTLESDSFYPSIGDWIIKGIKNEIYACKPDIFEATYEKVEP